MGVNVGHLRQLPQIAVVRRSTMKTTITTNLMELGYGA